MALIFDIYATYYHQHCAVKWLFLLITYSLDHSKDILISQLFILITLKLLTFPIFCTFAPAQVLVYIKTCILNYGINYQPRFQDYHLSKIPILFSHVILLHALVRASARRWIYEKQFRGAIAGPAAPKWAVSLRFRPNIARVGTTELLHFNSYESRAGPWPHDFRPTNKSDMSAWSGL